MRMPKQGIVFLLILLLCGSILGMPQDGDGNDAAEPTPPQGQFTNGAPSGQPAKPADHEETGESGDSEPGSVETADGEASDKAPTPPASGSSSGTRAANEEEGEEEEEGQGRKPAGPKKPPPPPSAPGEEPVSSGEEAQGSAGSETPPSQPSESGEEPAPADGDRCALLSQSTTFENVQACLDSFPFNQSRYQATVESMARVLPMHVFLDIAKNTPNKTFQPDYDLEGEFQKQFPKDKEWRNDREWQEALHDLFRPLNDAHCSFIPMCYRRISYTQAFYPAAFIDASNVTRIIVGGLPSPVAKEDSVHLGREVLSVDGVPAFDYFWKYANTEVGKYKDPNTRLNDVMASMVWDDQAGWGMWGGSFSSPSRLPSKAHVTWTLAAGKGRPRETIQKPWRIKLPNTKFANAAEYWTKFCDNPPKPIPPDEIFVDGREEEPAASADAEQPGAGGGQQVQEGGQQQGAAPQEQGSSGGGGRSKNGRGRGKPRKNTHKDRLAGFDTKQKDWNESSGPVMGDDRELVLPSGRERPDRGSPSVRGAMPSRARGRAPMRAHPPGLSKSSAGTRFPPGLSKSGSAGRGARFRLQRRWRGLGRKLKKLGRTVQKAAEGAVEQAKRAAEHAKRVAQEAARRAAQAVQDAQRAAQQAAQKAAQHAGKAAQKAAKQVANHAKKIAVQAQKAAQNAQKEAQKAAQKAVNVVKQTHQQLQKAAKQAVKAADNAANMVKKLEENAQKQLAKGKVNAANALLNEAAKLKARYTKATADIRALNLKITAVMSPAARFKLVPVRVLDPLRNTTTSPGRKVDAKAPTAQLRPPPNATLASEGLGFFRLKVNSTVAVLHVTTFAIHGKKSEWRTTLANIIKEFRASNCRKLIIDVTGNGGGYIDLAYELLAVVSPTQRGPYPMVDQRIMRDFRLSPLMKSLVEHAVKYQIVRTLFHPAWYGIPSTRKWYTDEKLISPPNVRDFGNSATFEFSQYYKEVPVTGVNVNPLVNLTFGLTANDIVLVGNGDCGSACGLFYHHLREIDRIPAAVTSYRSCFPRTPSAFPATEVYTLHQVISEGNKLGMSDDPLLPDPLPIQAVYRFPIREAYCRRKGKERIPLEYVRIGADVKVDVDRNLLFRPDLVWERLAWQLAWIPALPAHHTFQLRDDELPYATESSEASAQPPLPGATALPGAVVVGPPPPAGTVQVAPLLTNGPVLTVQAAPAPRSKIAMPVLKPPPPLALVNQGL